MPLYHGTRAHLQVGDLVEPQLRKSSKFSEDGWVYVTDDLPLATWFATRPNLLPGHPPVVYEVEATGPLEHDPRQQGRVGDRYRSRSPFRVTAILTDLPTPRWPGGRGGRPYPKTNEPAVQAGEIYPGLIS
jgi:hypothetical protein